MQNNDTNDVTYSLAQAFLKDKRASRRWQNVRFICWFALIIYIIFNLFHSDAPSTQGHAKRYAALVKIDGMIAPGRTSSAATLIPILEDAFRDKKAQGVIIDINSPGGTPVQASIIHDAIVRFKNQYHKKVIVVGEDMLTSGAYFIAVAGDEIYVNPNTLTGSVGVIMQGFGFVDLIKKIGVERRVYTAGANKDRLDPFLPQTPEDEAKIKSVMDEVHQNFIAAVLAGRKGKLHADPANLFTGDFWSGTSALKLGLVDHLGNLMEANEQTFGTTTTKEYGGSSLMRLFGGELNSTFDKLIYTYS